MKRLSIPRIVFLACIITAGLLLIQSCKKQPVNYPSETRAALGTEITVTIFDEGQVVEDLQRVFNQVFTTADQWEEMVAKPGPHNELSKITAGAGSLSVVVDTTVFEMLMAATRLNDATGKYFDVRVGPYVDIWGFESTPRVPSEAEIDSALQLVQHGGMFVAGKSILLAKPGMHFNVRDFLEGYVLDQMADELYARGFRNFAITTSDAGRFFGTPPDEKGFVMSLHHPQFADSHWADLYVPAGGVAYATTTRDRFTADGKTYHSMLDPHTGMPSASAQGVVIAAENAGAAQALAHAELVRPDTAQVPEKGTNMILGKVVIAGEPDAPRAETSGVLADKLKLGN